MPTINGKACVVNGTPVDKVFSDSRKVYGRNLLLGTSDSEGKVVVFSGDDTDSITTINGSLGDFSNMDGKLKQSVGSLKLKQNTDYMLIFDYEITGYDFYTDTDGNNMIGIGLGSGDNAGKYTIDSISKRLPYQQFGGAIGHLVYKINIGGSPYQYFAMRPLCLNKASYGFVAGHLPTIEITNLKVEEGTIATDWTPAPEDVM